MTLSVQDPFNEHDANGVTTVFAYEFRVIAASHLVVKVDGAIIPSSDYSVSGVGDAAGGSVTFDTAPDDGAVVLLSREVPLARSIAYATNGPFPAVTVNQDFDLLWMVLQRLSAIYSGVLRTPYPATLDEMPSKTTLAGRLLAFDASGQPEESSVTMAQIASAVAAAYAGSSGPLDALSFIQAGTGAVSRTGQNKLRETYSVTDFLSDTQRADVLAGTAAEDVTTELQQLMDNVATAYFDSASYAHSMTVGGADVILPPGRYLVTDTLYIPTGVRLRGSGWGTIIEFAPTSGSKSFMQKRNVYSTGGLRRTNHGMVVSDMIITTKSSGITTTNRSGVANSYPTYGANTLHCFDFDDCEHTHLSNLLINGFVNGTGIRFTNGAAWSWFNLIQNCKVRNSKKDMELNTGCTVLGGECGGDDEFPFATYSKDNSVVITGAGVALIGLTMEARCSNAHVKDEGGGASITGCYFEPATATYTIDATGVTGNGGGHSYHGNHNQWPVKLPFNAKTSPGGSDRMTPGIDIGYGSVDEVYVPHLTAGTPSFRFGFNGYAHSPAGGTVAFITGPVDRKALELSRAAGTSATMNQITYNFKMPAALASTLWMTLMVKFTGETNYSLFINDGATRNLKKLVVYDNGWELWGTYLEATGGNTITLTVRQAVGSTDTAIKLAISSPRFYVNGFKAYVAPYKWEEAATAAPSDNGFVIGEVVRNANVANGGSPGWIWTNGSAWKAMAAVAA